MPSFVFSRPELTLKLLLTGLVNEQTMAKPRSSWTFGIRIDERSRWKQFGMYLFSSILLVFGIGVLAVGMVEQNVFFALMGILVSVFGACSIAEAKHDDRSSVGSSRHWPHWLLIPLVLFLFLPTQIKDGDFARINLQFVIIVLFTFRWVIAAHRKERNLLWMFYCALAVLLYPLFATIASWFPR